MPVRAKTQQSEDAMKAVQDWWRQVKAAGARRAALDEEEVEDVEISAGSDSEYEPVETTAGARGRRRSVSRRHAAPGRRRRANGRYAGGRYGGSDVEDDEGGESSDAVPVEEVPEKTAGGRTRLRAAAMRLQGAANRARAKGRREARAASRSRSRSRSRSLRRASRRDRARGAALQRAANSARALSRRVGGADTTEVRRMVMARASALRLSGTAPGPALSQAWREARGQRAGGAGSAGGSSKRTQRSAGTSASASAVRTSVASRAAALRRENPALSQSDAMRSAWRMTQRC